MSGIIRPQVGGLDISVVRIMGLLVEMVVLGIILICVIVAVGSASIAARSLPDKPPPC